MKKNILVLILVLLSSIDVYSQKVRTTAVFDSDTTTRPKSGFTGLGFRNGRLFAVPFTGTTYRVINANTHVGTSGQVLSSNGTNNFFKTLGLSDVGITGLSNSQLLATDVTGQLQTLTTVTYPSLTETSYLKGVTSAIQTQINSKFNTPSGLTTNYLPKWNGSAFVNSQLFDNGAVGIGTTNMNNSKLAVNGLGYTNYATFSDYSSATFLIGNDGAGGIRIGSDGTQTLRLAVAASDKMSIFSNGNVAIGTTSAAATAILDLTSTTKGLLPPRMTTTQINAISSPANGLMVYNTTLNKLCVYENGTWKQVTTTNM